jgi:hypothetical protein
MAAEPRQAELQAQTTFGSLDEDDQCASLPPSHVQTDDSDQLLHSSRQLDSCSCAGTKRGDELYRQLARQNSLSRQNEEANSCLKSLVCAPFFLKKNIYICGEAVTIFFCFFFFFGL